MKTETMMDEEKGYEIGYSVVECESYFDGSEDKRGEEFKDTLEECIEDHLEKAWTVVEEENFEIKDHDKFERGVRKAIREAVGIYLSLVG